MKDQESKNQAPTVVFFNQYSLLARSNKSIKQALKTIEPRAQAAADRSEKASAERLNASMKTLTQSVGFFGQTKSMVPTPKPKPTATVIKFEKR